MERYNFEVLLQDKETSKDVISLKIGSFIEEMDALEVETVRFAVGTINQDNIAQLSFLTPRKIEQVEGRIHDMLKKAGFGDSIILSQNEE